MTTETSTVLPDNLAPIERLPMKVDEYEYLAWLDHHRLVTQYDPSVHSNAYTVRIGVIALDAEPVTVLDLPPHPQCVDKPYGIRLPVVTANGHLAYLVKCSINPPFGEQFDYPMLYDPQTSVARPVRSDKFDPITAAGGIGFVDDYSFFPDLKTGVLVDSWTGSRQLHIFDETSVTRVDLGVDVVGKAQIAPNGAVIGIVTQQGSGGIAMLDEPYQVELVDPTTWERRPLFDGYFAHSISWSPDSQHFVVVTSETHDAPPTIWVVNAETGVRRRIAVGHFGSVAWSPDGRKVAAMRSVKPESVMNTETELVLLDLTQVELP